jgi:hypothetical protein
MPKKVEIVGMRSHPPKSYATIASIVFEMPGLS